MAVDVLSSQGQYEKESKEYKPIYTHTNPADSCLNTTSTMQVFLNYTFLNSSLPSMVNMRWKAISV